MRVKILTLAIGDAYRRDLEACLTSKRTYATAHEYTYIQGEEKYLDRSRPIPWSKVPFLLEHLRASEPDDLIWLSDADVLITNSKLRIETHVLPIFPTDKNMLICRDACHNINTGNLFLRPSPWLIDFFERVWNRTESIHHGWWENKAVIDLLNENEEDRKHTEVTNDHTRFNAYLANCGTNEPLWNRNNWLIHFASLPSSKIAKASQAILTGKFPRT